MSDLCRLFGHRKPFRIMSVMIWERIPPFGAVASKRGHNATVGCFYCGWRRRMGAVWIDSVGVV